MNIRFFLPLFCFLFSINILSQEAEETADITLKTNEEIKFKFKDQPDLTQEEILEKTSNLLSKKNIEKEEGEELESHFNEDTSFTQEEILEKTSNLLNKPSDLEVFFQAVTEEENVTPSFLNEPLDFPSSSVFFESRNEDFLEKTSNVLNAPSDPEVFSQLVTEEEQITPAFLNEPLDYPSSSIFFEGRKIEVPFLKTEEHIDLLKSDLFSPIELDFFINETTGDTPVEEIPTSIFNALRNTVQKQNDYFLPDLSTVFQKLSFEKLEQHTNFIQETLNILTSSQIIQELNYTRGSLCERSRKQLSLENDAWRGLSYEQRFFYTLQVAKKYSLNYGIEPELMTCLVSKENHTFSPGLINFTLCTTKESTAIGLTQITRSTVKDLHNNKYYSLVPKYKNEKRFSKIYDTLTQSPELQIERSMAILGKLKSPVPLTISSKNSLKNYNRSLKKYYAHPCREKNNMYAKNILNCYSCLKRSNQMFSKKCLARAQGTLEEKRYLLSKCGN